MYVQVTAAARSCKLKDYRPQRTFHINTGIQIEFDDRP